MAIENVAYKRPTDSPDQANLVCPNLGPAIMRVQSAMAFTKYVDDPIAGVHLDYRKLETVGVGIGKKVGA